MHALAGLTVVQPQNVPERTHGGVVVVKRQLGWAAPIECADVCRDKSAMRGLRDRGKFSERDWIVYALVVAFMLAAAGAAAFWL